MVKMYYAYLIPTGINRFEIVDELKNDNKSYIPYIYLFHVCIQWRIYFLSALLFISVFIPTKYSVRIICYIYTVPEGGTVSEKVYNFQIIPLGSFIKHYTFITR